VQCCWPLEKKRRQYWGAKRFWELVVDAYTESKTSFSMLHPRSISLLYSSMLRSKRFSQESLKQDFLIAGRMFSFEDQLKDNEFINILVRLIRQNMDHKAYLRFLLQSYIKPGNLFYLEGDLLKPFEVDLSKGEGAFVIEIMGNFTFYEDVDDDEGGYYGRNISGSASSPVLKDIPKGDKDWYLQDTFEETDSVTIFYNRDKSGPKIKIEKKSDGFYVISESEPQLLKMDHSLYYDASGHYIGVPDKLNDAVLEIHLDQKDLTIINSELPVVYTQLASSPVGDDQTGISKRTFNKL